MQEWSNSKLNTKNSFSFLEYLPLLIEIYSFEIEEVYIYLDYLKTNRKIQVKFVEH